MTKRTAKTTVAPVAIPQTLKEALATVPSNVGNKPWQHKVYTFVARNEHLLSDAPDQVRALVATAKEQTQPFEGSELGRRAVAAGRLKTKQDPHLIFAYYRKHLEAFGLTTHHYERRAKATA